MAGRQTAEAEAQRVERTWNTYYATVAKPSRCISCERSRIGWNGSRKRSASLMAGGEVVYVAKVWCRRVKCSPCRKSWTLRPEGLMPHKHYQLCVVANAASEYVFNPRSTQTSVAIKHGCARRTVRRWIVWLAQLAEPAALLAKVVLAVGAPVVPRLRNVTSRVGTAPLARAAEALALLEDLGSAWRLEPPGLRAVLERVVGDRTGIATYGRPSIPELAQSLPG